MDRSPFKGGIFPEFHVSLGRVSHSNSEVPTIALHADQMVLVLFIGRVNRRPAQRWSARRARTGYGRSLRRRARPRGLGRRQLISSNSFEGCCFMPFSGMDPFFSLRCCFCW